MITNVYRVRTRSEQQFMCALVARSLDQLTWRHSGLGMLQAYLHEGGSEELRVHVWDPRLRRPGIEESGLLHDHRFDMLSHVLVGQVAQVEYHLEPHGLMGKVNRRLYVLHEVVHARKAFAEGKTHDGGVVQLPGVYTARTQMCTIDAGSSYSFPARKFHGTWHEGLTVTLIHKTNQGDYPARILAPYDKPVVHAFADPLPPDAWRPVLHDAKVALLQAVGCA